MGNMVYIAKKIDGTLAVHTDKQAMYEMDGVKPELTITASEFEAADSMARIINGKIVIGKTDAEKAEEENQKRIAEIDAELDDIDRKSIRSARSVTDAIAKGKTAQTEDIAKLDEYEKEASNLRDERASLITE